MIKNKLLDKILKKVEKPARYIGMEKNSIVKDFDATKIKMVFCFPDVYEIGMSYLGLHILYFLINENEKYLCERAFCPWDDMEKLMRENDIALYSLENKKPLSDFDIVGFTLQYEMSYTNIINMMDMSGIKFRSAERTENDPLIVAGGPCACNPEPLSDIVDIFQIGEGEELMMEFLSLYEKKKEEGWSKKEFLREAAKLDGFYVPAFYTPIYNEDNTLKGYKKAYEDIKDKIKRIYVKKLDDMYIPKKLIVPYIDIVHSRVILEIFRGCTKGCRFCQAGMLYRPIREKTVDLLINNADELVSNTGYDDISLSSLSTCDYSSLNQLAEELIDKFSIKKVGISLPSLRLDSPSIDVLKEIEKVRKSSLTFAPEAGTQRLRNVINKNVSEENLEEVMRYIFKEGWSKVKLYFMLGLPTETMEDVSGIKELAYKVRDMFFKRDKKEILGDFRLVISSSCFVPKPFTPFQWVEQNSIEEFKEKIYYLNGLIKDSKIKYNYHDPELSSIEAIFARGDRKLGEVIIKAHYLGAKMDGWDEFFSYERWMEAFKECNIDPFFYSRRKRDFNEFFPWDIIDIGVSKDYLLSEYLKSLDGIKTDDCRKKCNGCGIRSCAMRDKNENFV